MRNLATAALAIATLMLLFRSGAHAQRHEIGLTMGALAGASRSSPQGALDLGSGIAFQANYGYRFFETRHAAFTGEFHFLANPLRDIDSTNSAATRDVATIYAVPGLRVKFLPARSWQPYGVVGAGYALYEQSFFQIGGGANPAPRFTHRGALGFGGGVDIPRLWRFVGARFEVRDFYSGSPSYNVPVSGGQHNVVAGGGLLLTLGSGER